MSYWHHVQLASGLGASVLWVVGGSLVAAFILVAAAPAARVRIRAALILLAISVVGLLAAGAIGVLDGGAPGEGSVLYHCVRGPALFLLGVALINVAGVFVFEVLLRALRVGTPVIVWDLSLAIAYAVVALAVLSAIGVNLTGIVATSAVVTAIIGFSLQDTLGNLIGGIALQLERTIGVGDWIRLADVEGQVTEIRWRHTSMETRDWDTVVFPNSVLLKSQVTVLGRRAGHPRQRRQWVHFHVDYRHAPLHVIDTVEAALRAEPIKNVALEPPPQCLVVDYKDSHASYAARYWLTDLASDSPTDSVVRSRIYAALHRAGITLSIPAQRLFITMDSEGRRRRKQGQATQQAAAMLERVELFQPLTPDERQELAGRLRLTPFVRGEAMTRQGAEAHWLYILVEGTAEVRVSADGTSRSLATLHPGDCFGEMGLMTGDPRTATVVALTDATCYRLDKDGFHDILHQRPEIAEQISPLLARRRVELEAVKEHLSQAALQERLSKAERDLLHRIRRFFAL
jgi:small-conductance mechanosensitive channel/CRP-like cAMP-binding protein